MCGTSLFVKIPQKDYSFRLFLVNSRQFSQIFLSLKRPLFFLFLQHAVHSLLKMSWKLLAGKIWLSKSTSKINFHLYSLFCHFKKKNNWMLKNVCFDSKNVWPKTFQESSLTIRKRLFTAPRRISYRVVT